MTVQRKDFDGPITFVCDECGVEDNTHCTIFSGALAKYKSRGGVALRTDDEWEHRCRDCAP